LGKIRQAKLNRTGMMDKVWFCSTRGNEGGVKITFVRGKREVLNFSQRQGFKGLGCFIKQYVKVLVSMEYSLERLQRICPNELKDVKMLNLMLMFRELLILHKDDHLDRAIMLKILGANIMQYEPNYPRSYGHEKCYTYQAIYSILQELSDL
jgi:hypothetical protein